MLYLKDPKVLVQLGPQMVLTKLLDMFNARMYNGQIMWKEQEHLLLLMKDVKAHDVAHLIRTIVEFFLSFFYT
jgi:hypothetical protein